MKPFFLVRALTALLVILVGVTANVYSARTPSTSASTMLRGHGPWVPVANPNSKHLIRQLAGFAVTEFNHRTEGSLRLVKVREAKSRWARLPNGNFEEYYLRIKATGGGGNIVLIADVLWNPATREAIVLIVDVMMWNPATREANLEHFD